MTDEEYSNKVCALTDLLNLVAATRQPGSIFLCGTNKPWITGKFLSNIIQYHTRLNKSPQTKTGVEQLKRR